MKNLLWLALLPFLAYNCTKENQKQVLFDMVYQVDLEIPAGLNTIEDHFFVFRNVTSTFDSLLSFHGYTREDIGEVNPKSVQLTALYAGEEYGFVQELSLNLIDEDNNGFRSEAFWRNEVPFNTGGILEAPGTLINAKSFFLEPQFDFELRLDTRQFTDTFISTRLIFSFVVRAD